MPSCFSTRLTAIVLAFAALACATGASAADWGYEYNTDANTKNNALPEQLMAQPLSLDGKKAPAALKVRTTPAAGKVTRPAHTADLIVIEHWLDLLGLVAPIEHGKLPVGPDYRRHLSASQNERFRATLSALVAGNPHEWGAIEKFWSRLTRVMEDEDQRDNYRLLFRSLLSMRADSSLAAEDERAMISEALGPKRIAEPGPPPLTEDAINAYTDWTCFLYEHSHPGKTVDADDNRELFALKIRDMFVNAPTDQDRAAMNDFPLNWAKFRIQYTDGSPEERELLASRMASKEGVKGLKIKNIMLTDVLSSPLWLPLLVKRQPERRTGGAQPQGTADSGIPEPAPVQEEEQEGRYD